MVNLLIVSQLKRTDRKFVFNFADPRSLVANHVAFTLQSSVENKNTICST